MRVIKLLQLGNILTANQNTSSWVRNFINNIFTQEFWVNIGNDVIRILAVIAIAFVFTKVANFLIRKLFKLRKNSRFANQRTITIMKLAENIAVYAIYFLVAVTALEFLGIPVTTLLAGAGIFGLAVGFGAQNLVKDIITGFFIILEDQFTIGDYVSIDRNFEGHVMEIGLRTTKIKGITGEIHILPNGSIMSVTNFSRDNSVAIVDIGVSHENDIKYVEKVIEELLERLPAKYKELVGMPTLLGVQSFGQHEVVLRVTAEVEPMAHFKICRMLRKEIKMLLDLKDIKVPYPHMVIVDNHEEKSSAEV